MAEHTKGYKILPFSRSKPQYWPKSDKNSIVLASRMFDANGISARSYMGVISGF